VLGSFTHKEKMLRSFYENGSAIPTRAAIKEAAARLADKASSDEEQDRRLASMEAWSSQLPLNIPIVRPMLVVLSWYVCLSYLIYSYSWMRWFLMIITVYSTGARAIGSGFDLIEMYLHSSIISGSREQEQAEEGKKDD
jgi:hypothetical protein